MFLVQDEQPMCSKIQGPYQDIVDYGEAFISHGDPSKKLCKQIPLILMLLA